MINITSKHYDQKGAVLIVSLIMLLLLTVIGITSMNTVTMEERMAGNMNDYNLAFQSAEGGLRGGEDFIRPLTVEIEPCDTAPCDIWEEDSHDGIQAQSHSWWAANGKEYGTPSSVEVGRTQDPFFVIKFQKFVSDSKDVGTAEQTGRVFYNVMSSGIGGNDSTQSILESSFVKRYN